MSEMSVYGRPAKNLVGSPVTMAAVITPESVDEHAAAAYLHIAQEAARGRRDPDKV
ncbi:hypothetical protein [Mycobacteroides abscessus]|uniref:hypothetical protein n=1 Tax=Mycobacteroides abscessus TaxID=36809 RepID=UPI0005E74852|nr:hypothetical protein [Mycobacteroides abscessus]CPW71559.1 Uncharacterised protein [Mycobacteroides abscessus]SKF62117.1 Uncharacterised protein [Mycobacteroides abscessus subsp. bolletii]SKH91698.1 Uncharacterised protein [Mycobacteroides abscessus subsp. bolletii]